MLVLIDHDECTSRFDFTCQPGSRLFFGGLLMDDALDGERSLELSVSEKELMSVRLDRC